LTVHALTDLAGGASSCPGCDGVTPADVSAARDNPVGNVYVHLYARDGAGAMLDLGELTLIPTDAGTASGSTSVPVAPAYTVVFARADVGFALCAGAEPEVTITPTEGGLFAAFRLWRGCPVGGDLLQGR
jgi:hypothetical protein